MSSRAAMPSRVLVATRNPGKRLELGAFFEALGVELVDLSSLGIIEEASEDGLESFDTFEENALAKARHFHEGTGLPTIADDSGLAVDALDGAPGVQSKRYSGATGDSATVTRANNAKLLRALAGASNRRARFVCAAAFVDRGIEVVERGESHGEILERARGAGGFGYDPYFLSDELGCTFAEADVRAKEGVSHRGRAFRRLVARLVDGQSRAI